MPTRIPSAAVPRNGHPCRLHPVQNRSAESPTFTVSNVVRLRLLMALFRIRQRDVCAATRYSKAYLSQVLADDGFQASDRFWMRLNGSLHSLIRDSAANVFDVAPVILDHEREIVARCVDGGVR